MLVIIAEVYGQKHLWKEENTSHSGMYPRVEFSTLLRPQCVLLPTQHRAAAFFFVALGGQYAYMQTQRV